MSAEERALSKRRELKKAAKTFGARKRKRRWVRLERGEGKGLSGESGRIEVSEQDN